MKVGIIGACLAGSTTAYTLAIEGTANEIVLVDINKQRADAEADALGHLGGEVEEFADAGGAHLPCGRRDQFIIIHHRTVHSLSSISSS